MTLHIRLPVKVRWQLCLQSSYRAAARRGLATAFTATALQAVAPRVSALAVTAGMSRRHCGRRPSRRNEAVATNLQLEPPPPPSPFLPISPYTMSAPALNVRQLGEAGR